jgi:hypothetical protein
MPARLYILKKVVVEWLILLQISDVLDSTLGLKSYYPGSFNEFSQFN